MQCQNKLYKTTLIFSCYIFFGIVVSSGTRAYADPPSSSAVLQSFEEMPQPASENIEFRSDQPTEEAAIDEGAGTDFTLTELKIEGVTAFPESDLTPFFQPYLGTEVTPKKIFEIAKEITKYYHEQGYILSRAYVPEQSIEKGSATIQVIEGYVSKVIYRWIDMPPDNRIRFYAERLRKSKPLLNDDLERALLLIKDLPGVDVSATLRPSQNKKFASEIVLVIERKATNILLDSSSGNEKSMGKWRQFGSMSLNSFFGMDEQITLFGAMPSHPYTRMMLYGAEASVPLTCDGMKLHLKADTLRTKPEFDVPNIKSEGKADNMSIGVRMPVILTRPFSWYIAAWLDYKTSEDRLWKASTLVQDRYESLRVGRLETSLDFADSFAGTTLLTLSYSQGFKGLGARIRGDTRTGAKPAFTKFSGTLSRVQHVAGGLALYALVRGQYALGPLLSLERFNYGGAPFNHVYQSGFLNGDSGIEGKFEIRYTAEVGSFIKHLQFFGYYDQGTVWNKRKLAGEEKRTSAAGTAVGVRAGMDLGLSMFVEYGMPSKKYVNAVKTKKQLYFGLTFNQQALGSS